MTKQEAIIRLKIEKDLTLFDPITGETMTPEELKFRDEEAYKFYEAAEIAIEALCYSAKRK